MSINPLDRDALRERFQSAKPFPHLVLENFLEADFARELAAAFPTYEAASRQGLGFEALNEKHKIQITDTNLFPEPIQRLHRALASPEFLDDLSFITGIPDLLADPELAGGGIHVTGPQGRLDVHVDFNLVEDRALYRRLNILIYLNERWEESWGGAVELWDPKVRTCHESLLPLLNRCVLFQTSEISFHGVAAVKTPPDVNRQSFAAYYYTREAPEGWAGRSHTTIFRARPDERFRGYVLMPLERAQRAVNRGFRRVSGRLKRAVGG
jgi:Rps23 Pro-64 3,4-dihydroxylase Tpa1-like proline 4-hydroxylase